MKDNQGKMSSSDAVIIGIAACVFCLIAGLIIGYSIGDGRIHTVTETREVIPSSFLDRMDVLTEKVDRMEKIESGMLIPCGRYDAFCEDGYREKKWWED